MVGADDRPRRGGGGCVRADNREIDDGEQGGGGRFCRHGAPTTVDKEVFSVVTVPLFAEYFTP